MRIDIMTLFPDMCRAVLDESIVGRARKAGKVEIEATDIRAYTENKYRNVDDTPYGGGMGMVMQTQPVYDCYQAICQRAGDVPHHLIYLTPQGKTLTQQRVKELAGMEHLVLLCGHYEGIDERVIEELQPEEISVGDYVLTGGELPALVLADSVTRLLPGVLSDAACFEEESHYNSLLEYPQYTRPPVWRGGAGGAAFRPPCQHCQVAAAAVLAAHLGAAAGSLGTSGFDKSGQEDFGNAESK